MMTPGMKTRGMLAVAAAMAAAAGLLALAHAGLAQDKKAAAPAATSPCKGLDQAACAGKATDCQWITPKKGKQRPYCRLKSKPAKKAAAPKTPPAKP